MIIVYDTDGRILVRYDSAADVYSDYPDAQVVKGRWIA